MLILITCKSIHFSLSSGNDLRQTDNDVQSFIYLPCAVLVVLLQIYISLPDFNKIFAGMANYTGEAYSSFTPPFLQLFSFLGPGGSFPA